MAGFCDGIPEVHVSHARRRRGQWLAPLVFAAMLPASSIEAAFRASADVSVHVQYRAETGRALSFRVTNVSTAGESIGSVLLIAPGPAWSIRACQGGPAGWTASLVSGACEFRSAPGRMDDIPAGAGGTFQATVDVAAGATDAFGVWAVRVAPDENVTADSPLASGGEGGLSAAIHVFEIVDVVVSAVAVAVGGACPAPARQALAGSTRTFVICGRSHADAALTPLATASTLDGPFIAAPGTFTSSSAPAGFQGVLATWDGARVTTTPGTLLIVRTTIGSSVNATSPVTELGGYHASAPVSAPTLTATLPASPANANAIRVVGRAEPFTTVRLYTDASCALGPIASGTSADFELSGFAVSAYDNSTTTFHATATDGFGTVSPCSAGLTFVEDSTAPAFAGLRTVTALGSSSVRLSWQAASDLVSPAGDLVYEICRATAAGGCGTFRTDYTTTAGARTLDATGLQADQRYFFVVRARDRAGNRDANSVQVSGRTLGAKPNVKVAAGGDHACALHADGGLVCWGKNTAGQVGRGTSTRTSEPILVLRGVVDVAASIGDFTCAVLSDGRVRCWGANTYGQLGDGSKNTRYSPTEVVGITNAVAVSTGGAHACALLAGGTVRCWGLNAQGELGDGTTADSATPVTVAGIDDAKAIAAGTQHSCAIVSNGNVRCWGLNEFGQLGDGTRDVRHTPVRVYLVATATAIAAGHWHNCAILATGETYCWGRGDVGQLGNGDTDDQDVPVQVDMPNDAVAVAAGGPWDRGWSCVATADGFQRCWGSNERGQFGLDFGWFATSRPETLTSYPDVAAIATGGRFGCFVLAHGSLFCSGSNDYGQLADPNAADPSRAPVAVDLVRASMGVRVSSGWRHTCATVSDGTARCWGHNGSGRLGDGTTTASSIPVRVTGVSGVRSLSAGGAHSCAVVADGTVKCWGLNASGQLGDGTTTDRTTAVTVSGLSDIVAVAAGGAFTCALGATGRIWCFGDNAFQQLGSGWSASPVPVEITGLPAAIALAAGANHACAVFLDGWASCWGHNASGQVGPHGPLGQFGFAPGAVGITAGADHSCALLADGTSECWGSNLAGQLGDGTLTSSAQPVPVTGIANVTELTAAGSHTCARLADASVQCWGANALGQLGNGSTQAAAGKVVVRNLGATSIEAGLDHTCGMVVDGTIRCWGAGADGRLGNGSTANQSTRVQVTPFP